jgi:hypothetical protein
MPEVLALILSIPKIQYVTKMSELAINLMINEILLLFSHFSHKKQDSFQKVSGL